jgi:hypothetical protein
MGGDVGDRAAVPAGNKLSLDVAFDLGALALLGGREPDELLGDDAEWIGRLALFRRPLPVDFTCGVFALGNPVGPIARRVGLLLPGLARHQHKGLGALVRYADSKTVKIPNVVVFAIGGRRERTQLASKIE